MFTFLESLPRERVNQRIDDPMGRIFYRERTVSIIPPVLKYCQ
jgi:hypothetical protein